MNINKENVFLNRSLSISCVTFDTNEKIFFDTINSLADSCDIAKKNGGLNYTHLYLIDNGPDIRNYQLLVRIKIHYELRFEKISVLSGHDNIGYGGGNNLAIFDSNCSYHLVLNPDVILARDNIATALNYMNDNDNVGLLAPDAFDEKGERQYLAKRMPSMGILIVRALPIKILRKLFLSKMNAYEYRDLIPSSTPIDIELASGCFMFIRTRCVKEIKGFDPKFFMYFEDFDLSIRLRNVAKVVYNPNVIIKHFGGRAATKGCSHLRYFFTSYMRFIKLWY